MPEIVEALYDFQPQGEDDVEIRQGQQIEVYEHLSADWLRGKNLDTGREGVLPANYVRPAEKRRSFSRPPAPPPPGQSASPAPSRGDYPEPYSEKEQYQPPPASWGQQQYQPPQYQQYAPPQQYQPPQQYAPPQQQYPEQVMMPQQQQAPPPQQQHRHHGQFGNLARRFGDSVVFGAGATLGGDLINKIF